jgi:hypothetical protein
MQSLSKIINKPMFSSLKLNWLTYFFIPLTFVLILRNGINFIGQDHYAIAWAKKWPKPESVYSVENSGNIILAKLFSIDSQLSWMILHLTLSISLFFLLVMFCHQVRASIEQKQTLLFLILVSPLTMMIMQQIGWHDVITITGALILAFGDKTAIRIIGTLIMCLGNTPQALVATLLFGLLLNIVQNFNKKNNFKLFIPFAVSLIIWILERFWLGGLGREGEFFNPGFWLYSVKGFLIAFPLYLYAILGPLWFIAPNVWEKFKTFPKKQTILTTSILLVIPSAFGIVTTDSSRDALCIMSPLLLWFFRYLVLEQKLVLKQTQKIALILMPCFLVYREGQIIPPWSVFDRFFF